MFRAKANRRGGGEHWCCLYKTAEEHRKLITEFIRDGLDKNEAIDYVLHKNSKEDILNYFVEGGIELSKYLESGQLSFLCANEVYLQKLPEPDGLNQYSFDPDTVIQRLKDRTITSLAKGFTRYRVAGEMCWIEALTSSQLLMEYEYKLHNFFEEYHCTALCQYDCRLFKPSCLLGILTSHPKAMIGTESYDNFYYTPPSAYCGGDPAAHQLEAWIENLAERKALEITMEEKTRELEHINEALQHEIHQKEDAQNQRALAEALSQAKSEFVATVSHEIRTPLNGIICTSNLLHATPLSPEQEEFVRIIEVSGQHLITVLNDVLDFSKIESKQLVLQEADFSVEQCVQNVMDILRQSFLEKGVLVSCEISPDVQKECIGDITRISQILVNLVSNAIKFTPSGGKIWIDVRNQAERQLPHEPVELLFSVKDTGIGIPKNKFDLIFRAFTQVDSSCTRKYGGTGLGLAICKRLVEAMGGQIWFDSVVGEGTTFFFTIKMTPAKKSERLTLQKRNFTSIEAQEINAPLEDDMVDSPRLDILVAEDNSINQIIIKKLLAKFGHSVTIVGDGLHAVKEIQAKDYDLVFMDLQMPHMGGLEATKLITQGDWSGRNRPMIVALTASALEEDKKMCSEAGMDLYLLKPLSIADIQQVCRTVQMSSKRRKLPNDDE